MTYITRYLFRYFMFDWYMQNAYVNNVLFRMEQSSTFFVICLFLKKIRGRYKYKNI